MLDGNMHVRTRIKRRPTKKERKKIGKKKTEKKINRKTKIEYKCKWCLRKTKLWWGLETQATQIIKTESGLKTLAKTQPIQFGNELSKKIPPPNQQHNKTNAATNENTEN